MLQAGRGESGFDEDNYQPPAMHVNLCTVSQDSGSSLTAQLQFSSLPKDGEAADPILHKASIACLSPSTQRTDVSHYYLLQIIHHFCKPHCSESCIQLVQVLYRWAISERLKLLVAMVNGRGDDVAATLNPQAGEVRCCGVALKMQCTQQTLHIWWH